MSALTVDDLTIGVASTPYDVIDDIALRVEPGEIVGVVGESTAGKSTLGLAVAGHLREGLRTRRGDVRAGGVSLLASGTGGSRRPRIGFVSQHPASALNPALRIDRLLSDMLVEHDTHRSGRSIDDRIREVLGMVSLPSTPEFIRRFPHQLSGGQQQRLLIAIALVGEPTVLVLDEPTSGLDRVTSARVFDTVRRLSGERALAVLCISHDLAVVADVADRVVVLYAGHVVEEGPTGAVLADPAHPYTRHLVAAVPAVDGPRAVGLPGRSPSPSERRVGCRFADRCDLARHECRTAVPPLVDLGHGRRSRCIDPFATPHRLRITETSERIAAYEVGETLLTLRDVSAAHGGTEVVKGVSLDVARGEWLAILGESGSGKTTLMRTIVGTHASRGGSIALDGTVLAGSVRDRLQRERDTIRLIPQHPYESFNPRRRLGDSVARPLVIGRTSRAPVRGAVRGAVREALHMVALDDDVAERYPNELSGGELQRAAIARAIIRRPVLLLCDEITASLDSIVKATIVELLHRLRTELDLTIVFVAHDPPLVLPVADRVAVMSGGRIVEIGPSATVLANRRDRPE